MDTPPKHVAIIMDGNGRWAQSRGLERIEGHKEGARSAREIVRTSRELGIEVLTLYSFSTENWKRPEPEVAALMALLEQYLVEERRELKENGIRLNTIGQIERLPKHVRVPLRLVMRETAGNTNMVLNLALSYGSRAELVGAVQAIAEKVKRRKLRPEDIDEDTVSAHLQTAGQPDPDLMIRTSGELRISNFLLWQLAYSELFVTDVPWPDFRKPQFLEALATFGDRERRFGKTGAQVKHG